MHRGNRNTIDLGSSVFREFIKRDLLFIDKSAFIEHVLMDASTVLLITRPRRMGKSLNLDMLRTFLDLKQDAVGEGLFKGLYIEKSPVFSEADSVPVIYLNFRDFRFGTHRQTYADRIEEMADIYVPTEKRSSRLKRSLDGKSETLTSALRYLTENIDAVCGIKPFVIIDEYDKQIMDSVGTESFREAIDFTKDILSLALKDNPSLGKAIVTGVNRISQESMFSDFNNPDVYDVLRSSAFDTDFGFTEEEVSELCSGGELSDIRDWYNGFRIGSTKVYFTYSVMSCLKSKRLANYWCMSGTINDIIPHITADRFDTITKVLNGRERVKVEIADRLSSTIFFHTIMMARSIHFSFKRVT